MCDAKPGTRCAADTRSTCVDAASAYRTAHPGGPDVEPLTGATSSFPVTVPDARGNLITVTPGVLDDNADYVFKNGQCLAFAKALQNRGMDVVFLLANPGHGWENTFGDEFDPADTELFVHAYGYDGYSLHDIASDGHDVDGTLEWAMDAYGEVTLVTVTPDQLDAVMAHPATQPQNVALAGTFVDAIYGPDDTEDVPTPSPYTPRTAPPDGYVDLYHRTTVESAAQVSAGSQMTSKENRDESYFSTKLDGQADGYGDAVVWVRVREDQVELDDEFPDGEQHFRVPNALIASALMRQCGSCGLWDSTDHRCA